MQFGLYVPVAGREVAAKLKHWDVIETELVYPYWDKFAVISRSIASSDLEFSVYVDNDGFADFVAVGGVGGDKENACIWLLTTEYTLTKPKRVIEMSLEYLSLLKDFGYQKVYNYVHPENLQTIRFLKFLGFTITNETDKSGLVKVELDLWNP